MKVLEHVPGVLLVLEVPSRSGGDPHVVTVVYEGEEIREVSCSCKGFAFNKKCWAIIDVKELAGKSSNRPRPMPPAA